MEQVLFRDTVENEDHKENQNVEEEDDEDAKAAVKIWEYVFGFTDMALVKCAIDLGIPDLLEKKGGSMSLSELSSSLACPTPQLHRIMRFLVHRKIFNLKKTSKNTLFYTQTPLSKRLVTHGKNSMVPFILLEASPTMLAPWLALSQRVVGVSGSAFDAVHGKDVWGVAAENLVHSKLINDAMACDAKVVMPQVIKECPDLLSGVCSIVDVGGGDGTALKEIVKVYPWIKGINFDLPHVVDANVPCEGIEHVSGDMFEVVRKADVVIIKWIFHDWGDEECIEILKKCKEAIPKDKGKVIILEAVIKEEDVTDKQEDARLMLDMVMMAHTTNGKERTLKEWNYVLKKSGFSRINVKPIHAVQSVIEAYP